MRRVAERMKKELLSHEASGFRFVPEESAPLTAARQFYSWPPTRGLRVGLVSEEHQTPPNSSRLDEERRLECSSCFDGLASLKEVT